MNLKPSDNEIQEVGSYDAQNRLQYFLTRVLESEEVWGLSNGSGWILKKENDRTILPVWPYRQMATDCATDKWRDYSAESVSLEHFIYKLLPIMLDQNIHIEIFPDTSKLGTYMDARALGSILEGMMESGEYYMEG